MQALRSFPVAIWRLAWRNRAESCLLVFATSCFLLPSGPAYGLVFYLTALPVFLRRIRVAPVSLGAAAGIGLIIWSAMTLLWGVDDGQRSWRLAQQALWTLIFVTILCEALRSGVVRSHLGSVLVWLGTGNAAVAILWALAFPQPTDRLHGIGITENPVLGAAVMAAPYLCALSRVLSDGGRSWRVRAAYLAASSVMALFVVLTESRGPILALGLGTVLVCVACPTPARALGALMAVAAGCRFLPSHLRHQQAALLMTRGSSHRFEIWQQSLERIGQSPFFGNGLAANLHFPGRPDLVEATFPHDLYLSVLFYSGLVGFAFFAVLVGCVTARLVRGWARRDADYLWVASLWLSGLVNGLTDLGQITKGPGEMWFIFWLPAVLTLTWNGVGAQTLRRARVFEGGGRGYAARWDAPPRPAPQGGGRRKAA